MTREELNEILDDLMFNKVANDFFNNYLSTNFEYIINDHKYKVELLEEDYQVHYGISKDETAFMVYTDDGKRYIVTWAGREVLDLNTGDWWIY